MELNLIIQQIVSPLFVLLATQGVKKASFIPINAGQTARLRTVAGVLSFGSALVLALANGELESFLSPDMIKVGVEGGLNFLVAHLAYRGLLKKNTS